ncbi:hypothetical protein GLOIN_2v1791191 [Rhizophagus irregularis DAOM 181602=DAOM 197198]|nr:hypothetical protein GLOIN_2v1791191 [Rhizophagus irregularis DAOM 181602=DAOM 197198]CAB5216836.1 unnamed protein product [Rhizophagus irregularis]
MPAQLSTILYISNYKESTAPNFFIGSATGITRLNENDSIQTFNITIFYPIDPSIPCYIPKLTNGQVLSVNNCKFSLGNNNEIDLIITAARILDIKPTDLPVHPIYITAVGLAADVPIISNHGVKIDCLISDYLSKDKIVEIPITIFHPLESRLKNQTTNIRRGSSLFFSGEITLVDNKLYLELHNFSFLKGQSQVPSNKSTSLPWLNTTTSESSTTQTNNAHLIHQEQRIPESTKRNIQKPFEPNKVMKLADIATNILDDQNENIEKTNDHDDDRSSENDSDVTNVTHDDKTPTRGKKRGRKPSHSKRKSK